MQFFRAVLITFSLLSQADLAAAACAQISTVQQLNNIRNNLSGDYCLRNDIDLASVPNWKPIGTDQAAFTGTLDGKGHVIRNLAISSKLEQVGFFRVLAESAIIKNLGLVNVSVRHPSVAGADPSGFAPVAYAGALVGWVVSSTVTIQDCHVTGAVFSGVDNFQISTGGLAGSSNGRILRSYSTASVQSQTGRAGGLTGGSFGTITASFATGPVTGAPSSIALPPPAGKGAGGPVGGLVGLNYGPIAGSYATGSVAGVSFVGGLVGENYGEVSKSAAAGWVGRRLSSEPFPDEAGGLVGANFELVSDSYATGRVAGSDRVGGLIGQDGAISAMSVARSFSIGPVFGTQNVGGLVGYEDGGVATRAYWDTQTSGLLASSEGVGRTTAQMQAALPAGFSAANWAITPGETYPYLRSVGAGFDPSLATIVFTAEPFTLLPIEQTDPAQYSTNISNKNLVSQAAVYTMIARAIGVTRNSPALYNAKINQYWDKPTNTALWQGVVTSHATLGGFENIGAQPLGQANVVGQLKLDRPVILRAKYKVGASNRMHWMLATSFTVDSGDNVNGIIADDPWTGKQVTIDPSTKRVVSPAGFPLKDLIVNGYQAVTFEPAP